MLPGIKLRRTILAASVVVAGAAGVALRAQQPSAPVTASDPADRSGRQISLEDQLRVGLKAVTKADFAFIELVVQRVDEGVLPRKLVDSTFLWSRRRVQRQRPQYRKRPMVYFQPALVLRSRAIGIDL
jgi:hypothetical protein